MKRLIIIGAGVAAVAAGAGVAVAVARRREGLTLEELRAIMPKLSATEAAAYLPHLNAALVERFEAFEGSPAIDTPARIAGFLAQLCVESGELRYWKELSPKGGPPAGTAYEGRRDLGNVRAGDGVKFAGVGPIQITGRANATACGLALGLPLDEKPELLTKPEHGFRGSAWFWHSRALNKYADARDIDAISYRVNGGWNGKEERRRYYASACKVLGVRNVA